MNDKNVCTKEGLKNRRIWNYELLNTVTVPLNFGSIYLDTMFTQTIAMSDALLEKMKKIKSLHVCLNFLAEAS